MTCDDVRKFLGPFLDSELDARTSYELGLHLNDCASCRDRVERERRLEAELASAAGRDDTTPEMWNRALGRLQPKRRWWPWAAAALLLAAGSAALLLPARPDLLRTAIADHGELLEGRFAPDVATPDGDRAAAYLRERVPVAAVLPANAPDCLLVGVRLCFFHGHPVGLVIYSLHEGSASLFLVPNSEMPSFDHAEGGTLQEHGLFAMLCPVEGAEFSVVAVGPAAARAEVERLATAVGSR